MKPLVGLLATVCVLISVWSSSAALVQRVESLDPQFYEGFEEDADLSGILNGLASVDGSAGTSVVVQNGNYFNTWDQHAFEGAQFLGAGAAYGTRATVEIKFQVPVTSFGGLFGHRVRPGVESAGETEFVFYDSRNREIGRDHVFIGSDPGSVPAYWKFGREVKRVTFTYFHPMADALVASVSPVQARKLNRKLPKVAQAQASATQAQAVTTN